MDLPFASYMVLFIVAALGYLIWDAYVNGEIETVRSTVDGNEYKVRSLPDKVDAANLLANIRKNLEMLVRHLEKTKPDDPRTLLLIQNFKADKISEGNESSKYTSYSVNKGERIVFCLRSKDAKKTLSDINTLMFVALHEVAHIATESVGHTPEFWENFKWILAEAMNIGIYSKQDFKRKPVPYCGMTITSSPMDN